MGGCWTLGLIRILGRVFCRNDDAKCLSSSSKFAGIEHIQSLVDQSIENLKQDDKEEMVRSGLITITKGDGRLGYEAFAPYALILRVAAARSAEALLSQLASPGG